MLLSWTQINMLLIDSNVASLEKSALSSKYHSLCVLMCVFLHSQMYFEDVFMKYISHMEILQCRQRKELDNIALNFLFLTFDVSMRAALKYLQLIQSNWRLTYSSSFDLRFLNFKARQWNLREETTHSSFNRWKSWNVIKTQPCII